MLESVGADCRFRTGHLMITNRRIICFRLLDLTSSKRSFIGIMAYRCFFPRKIGSDCFLILAEFCLHSAYMACVSERAMMAKVNFTADRVASFQCEPGKQQSILWDGKTPGLGLRVTAAGARSFVFEARLAGKTLRVTIGDVRTYTVAKAQAEATRYKVQTDQGIDPRQVRAEQNASQVRVRAELAIDALRDSVTLGTVWPVYVAERSPHWGEHQIAAHRKIIQAGGEKRKRSPKLTADRLTRARWRSRSGVTPSKARAPSNTVEPSHMACEVGPINGGLPGSHWPST